MYARQEAGAFGCQWRIHILDPRDRNLKEKLLQVAAETIEVAVLAGRGDHLPTGAGREQDRACCHIPVVEIVFDQLTVPFELSGPGIKNNDAACVKIVARAVPSDEIRAR